MTYDICGSGFDDADVRYVAAARRRDRERERRRCHHMMKALVGRNGYMMRRLVGQVVRSADDKRLRESQLCEKGRRGSLVEEDSARG